MVQKRSTLDSIEFGEDGTLMIRMRKQVWLDGELLKSDIHRTSIPPGTDATKQMLAVNVHLEQMGYAGLPVTDIDLITATAADRHTVDVIAAFKSRQE